MEKDGTEWTIGEDGFGVHKDGEKTTFKAYSKDGEDAKAGSYSLLPKSTPMECG